MIMSRCGEYEVEVWPDLFLSKLLRSIHSPSLPETEVMICWVLILPGNLRLGVFRWGLTSSVTRLPYTRGTTVKPVVTSRNCTLSITRVPCGVWIILRKGIGNDLPIWMKAWPPSSTCRRCVFLSLSNSWRLNTWTLRSSSPYLSPIIRPRWSVLPGTSILIFPLLTFQKV